MATDTDPKYRASPEMAQRRLRLREARKLAEADGMGQRTAMAMNHEVIVTYARPAAEQRAATEYVRSQEAWADEWTEDGPMWLGHALHAAFLAGVDYQRSQNESEQDDQLPAAARLGGNTAAGEPDARPAPERESSDGGPASAADEAGRLQDKWRKTL